MREYPDPKQYLDTHMKRSAKKYADGLQQVGLEPSPRLAHAMSERAIQEASGSYIQEANAVLDHNIKEIRISHKKRMNKIKREGANLRLKTCPLIALVFGILAWYSFSHSYGFLVGICSVVGAVSFLAMLILGAIFDRPSS